MIISKYVDANAMDTLSIIDKFCHYLMEVDHSKLSNENRKLIITLCNEYPIINILCQAMFSQGYEF